MKNKLNEILNKLKVAETDIEQLKKEVAEGNLNLNDFVPVFRQLKELKDALISINK